MDVNSLDRILKDRGVQIERSKLAAALDDASFSSWASLHLTPATLLSPDELATFSALSGSGALESLGAAAPEELPLPRDQAELQSAIREIDRSAEAISRQTETLRQQQEALARFARGRINDEVKRDEAQTARGHGIAVEMREARAAVEDLSRSLEVKLSELEQRAVVVDEDLRGAIEERLRGDDRLLTSLGKLSGEFNVGDRRGDELDGLRERCMKLIKCTVEMTRCRLDRTYLEALSTATVSIPRHSDDTDPAEVAALTEEVDSLYAEIFPVVQMSVENQFLQPAVRRTTGKNARALENSSVAVDYMNDCLNYLNANTEVLLSRIETLHSHRAATETIAGAARKELSKPVAKPRREDSKTRSPTRRRKGSSPVRTRSGSGPVIRRRRSSGPADEPPLEALLRTLSVTLPADMGERERIAALEGVLGDRERKLGDVAGSAQVAFEEAVRVHLFDARRAVAVLWGCVLGDSPYGEVRLVDEEVEASVGVMEGEVEGVKAKVRDVEPTRGRSEKKEELLQRWGQ